MRKQALSVTVATVAFAILSLNVFAAQSGDWTYDDNGGGTCTITGYTGSGGDITIPNTLGGLTVTIIGFEAFWNHDTLTSVIIPNGVVTIGNGAFCDCENLTSIIIPDSVTSIEDGAFLWCYGLTSINLSEFVSFIGDSAFDWCNNLLEININTNNPTYSSVDGVLFNKNQTTLIQFPGGKAGTYLIPNSVTTIENGAFDWCLNLTSITIPDSVMTIGYSAFNWCNSLTEINVDTLNTTYSSIDGVLYNNVQTTLIQYPCGKAGPYSIPDGVTIIGNDAFIWCPKLSSLIIPGSVNTIEDWAFTDSQLLSLYFKGNAPTISADTFYGVNNATVYYITGTTGWESTFGGLPTAPWTLLAGDTDADKDVDIFDLALFASSWQANKGQPQYDILCDIVGDDVVNLNDLTALSDNWLVGTAISDHVIEIEIGLSHDWGQGYSHTTPVDYQFDAWMQVDETVVSGTLETPNGTIYPTECEIDDGEIWLGVYEWSTSLVDLSDFTDGNYVFTVTYADGRSQSTTIPFKAADGSPLTVPPRPVLTYPAHGSTNIPTNTNFILDPSNMTNPVWTFGIEYFPTEDSGLEGEFEGLPNTTTTVGPVNLSLNIEYEIELTASHAVFSTNNDGIPYVVDKDSEVEIVFTTAP